MGSFKVFENPRTIYKSMLKDILNAKKSIYLETYIYDDDKIGRMFKKALLKKAEEGLDIKILIDAWGSTIRRDYFNELIEKGAEVKFFKEIKYVIRFFTENHERNHRKLLILDEEIVYLGSINITATCLNWRELVLRLEGDISLNFSRSFFNSWNWAGAMSRKKIRFFIHKGYEIIQDLPRRKERNLEKKYIHLIKNAKKEILIETPYFVPSFRIRRAMEKAVKRGVIIFLTVPYNPDVKIITLLSSRYFGDLYKKGVRIYYYKKKILHSKLMIVDSSFFILGSSNVDYRSFRHQYEINLFGKDKKIIKELRKFYKEGLEDSIPFNYEEWKNRSSLFKIGERILYLIRRYF